LIMCSVISISVSFAQGTQSNLPNVADTLTIGRLTAFVSPRGTTWFFPAALLSHLKCLDVPAGSKSRVCTLTVTNALLDNEKSELSVLGGKTGGVVTHFTDLEPFVKNIDESFYNLPKFVTATPLLLRTLRLGPPNLSYASFSQRFSIDQADQLLTAYKGSGIGSFQVIVKFDGERTNGFVGLRDMAALTKRLDSLGAQFTYSEFHSAVNETLQTQLVNSGNVDLNSAAVLAEFFIRNNCIQLDTNGKYSVRQIRKECTSKFAEVYNETVSPVAIQCTATLVLSEDSLVSVKCATL
jgi:hypothetical protein